MHGQDKSSLKLKVRHCGVLVKPSLSLLCNFITGIFGWWVLKLSQISCSRLFHFLSFVSQQHHHQPSSSTLFLSHILQLAMHCNFIFSHSRVCISIVCLDDETLLYCIINQLVRDKNGESQLNVHKNWLIMPDMAPLSVY